jgi:hypothetical protein
VSIEKTFQIPVQNRQLDVLFVIDDTSAIAPHADAVAAGLADMARLFPVQRGPEISLHAGFIRAGTCDASTRGTACGVAAPDQFVRSEWCNTITNFNYGGGLGDAFACMGDLGAADCGPAQPLAAAVGWLAAWPRAGWEGFLRPDALLMVVVIAASDDPSDASGSPTPVQFANALKALKPDPSMVMATVIGPTGCDGDDIVDPRLREFVNQFGANGLYISVCGGSLGAVFDRAITFVGDPAPPCCAASATRTSPRRACRRAASPSAIRWRPTTRSRTRRCPCATTVRRPACASRRRRLLRRQHLRLGRAGGRLVPGVRHELHRRVPGLHRRERSRLRAGALSDPTERKDPPGRSSRLLGRTITAPRGTP